MKEVLIKGVPTVNQITSHVTYYYWTFYISLLSVGSKLSDHDKQFVSHKNLTEMDIRPIQIIPINYLEKVYSKYCQVFWCSVIMITCEHFGFEGVRSGERIQMLYWLCSAVNFFFIHIFQMWSPRRTSCKIKLNTHCCVIKALEYYSYFK